MPSNPPPRFITPNEIQQFQKEEKMRRRAKILSLEKKDQLKNCHQVEAKIKKGFRQMQKQGSVSWSNYVNLSKEWECTESLSQDLKKSGWKIDFISEDETYDRVNIRLFYKSISFFKDPSANK